MTTPVVLVFLLVLAVLLVAAWLGSDAAAAGPTPALYLTTMALAPAMHPAAVIVNPAIAAQAIIRPAVITATWVMVTTMAWSLHAFGYAAGSCQIVQQSADCGWSATVGQSDSLTRTVTRLSRRCAYGSLLDSTNSTGLACLCWKSNAETR